MDVFIQLFGNLLIFVYHCFDRIIIHGYLGGLSRPEQAVHFFRQVVGVAAVDKEVLSRRTADYQNWVEAFAHNHGLPIEWAEKGVRKEDHVLPWLRRMTKNKRVSERMCKQVSVSLPYRGDSHDEQPNDYTGITGSTAC